MRRVTAEAILRVAEEARWKPGKRVDGRLADLVISFYLKQERGAQEDRWGNFVLRSNEERYKLGRSVLRREKRSTKGYYPSSSSASGFRPTGEWFVVMSRPKVDYALIVLQEALKSIESDAVATVADQRKGRREASRTRSEARETKREDEVQAHAVLRRLGLERPDLAKAAAFGDRPALVSLRDEALDQRRQGWGRLDPERDPVDLDSGPAPWLALAGERYVFDVVQDGVRYTVALVPKAQGRADVSIGSSPIAGLGVSASLGIGGFGGLEYSAVLDAKGDGLLSAILDAAPSGRVVGQVFFVSASERRRGSGTRMLEVWCRLASLFGADPWVARAVGTEGAAWLDGLARKGRIEILGKEGSNVMATCVPSLFRRRS